MDMSKTVLLTKWRAGYICIYIYLYKYINVRIYIYVI